MLSLSPEEDIPKLILVLPDQGRDGRLRRSDGSPSDSRRRLRACSLGAMPWYRALPSSWSAKSPRRYVDLQWDASSSWPGVTDPHSTSSQRHCSGHSPFAKFLTALQTLSIHVHHLVPSSLCTPCVHEFTRAIAEALPRPLAPQSRALFLP